LFDSDPFMPFLDSFTGLFAENAPLFFMQSTIALTSFFLLFLLLYTLRDILQRTHSFAYQCFCVLLVGALPIVGFLVYLLIRPSRTLKEREVEEMLLTLLGQPLHTDPEDAPDLPEPITDPINASIPTP
jgi:hypothetical protein